VKRLATALLIGTLAGCGSDSTGPADQTPPDGPGFSATLTGAIDDTWEGQAVFGVEADPADGTQWIWGIYLDTGDPTVDSDVIVFTGLVDASSPGSTPTHGDFPGAGPYALEDAFASGGALDVGQQFAIVFRPPGGVVSSYYSSGGTVTITESSATQVRGTLSFSATGLAGTVSVTGTFTAEPGTFTPPPTP
jgi:hypothetical protein